MAATTTARRMHPDEGVKIRAWETQLKATTREQIGKYGTMDITRDTVEPAPSRSIATKGVATPDIQNQGDQKLSDLVQGVPVVERLDLMMLNEEQRRAHDIVEERLKEHITCESSE